MASQPMRTWEIATFVALFAGTFAVGLAAWASQPAVPAPQPQAWIGSEDPEGLTLATLQVNSSLGWTVSEGQRVLVPADQYTIDPSAEHVEIPSHVRTGNATGALAITDPGGPDQLVVAYGDTIEVTLPASGNGTAASTDVELAPSATSVSVTAHRCEVAVTDAQNAARTPHGELVLPEPGAVVTVRLSPTGEACPAGEVTLGHVAEAWQWSKAVP